MKLSTAIARFETKNCHTRNELWVELGRQQLNPLLVVVQLQQLMLLWIQSARLAAAVGGGIGAAAVSPSKA